MSSQIKKPLTLSDALAICKPHAGYRNAFSLVKPCFFLIPISFLLYSNALNNKQNVVSYFLQGLKDMIDIYSYSPIVWNLTLWVGFFLAIFSMPLKNAQPSSRCGNFHLFLVKISKKCLLYGYGMGVSFICIIIGGSLGHLWITSISAILFSQVFLFFLFLIFFIFSNLVCWWIYDAILADKKAEIINRFYNCPLMIQCISCTLILSILILGLFLGTYNSA